MMSKDNTVTQGTFLAATEALQQQLKPILSPPVLTILPSEIGKLSLQLTASLDLARDLIKTAELEAETIRSDARREGLKLGRADALSTIALARREYDSLHERAEQDLVKLALALARKIVGHHLEVDPSSLTEMISRTLRLARGRRHIELRVNEHDFISLRDKRERFALAAGNPALFFVADSTVPPGGCRIETEAGFIDADIDTQLNTLALALGVELSAEPGDLDFG